MTDLYELTARELLTGYRSGDFSPVEAVRSVLDRIEAVNEGVNAFCRVDAEDAMEAAKASRDRWRRGEPAGLVDGVPVSVKDILLLRGGPTLRGSKAVDPRQAWDEDAPSVARLREHGAVFIGKTTTPEFGWKGRHRQPGVRGDP